MISPNVDPLLQIVATCNSVVEEATYVTIDDEAIKTSAAELYKDCYSFVDGVEWDSCGWHYSADAASFGPLTCQYIFVMDALNFCFWPTPKLEYDYLATTLRKVLEADATAFSALNLCNMDAAKLQGWFPDFELPLLNERVKRLQELGEALNEEFDGLAANMVKAANNSATRLVQLVLRFIPGFRDTVVYRGRLVHLYKRAQILVGDVWAAYGKQRHSDTATATSSSSGTGTGTGTGGGSGPYSDCFRFHDLGKVTMFADYRVPQILRHMGIMRYREDLAARVDALQEVTFGSEEEVEIRAVTVVAVERLKDELNRLGRADTEAAGGGGGGHAELLSLEVDWLLWNKGEVAKDEILPHHRTRTIYY